MADVRPPRVGNADPDTATDEDRAQLILITGLTLAVILVAVVLILNTVIYTENLATRGVDAGGGEAIDFRDGAVEDVTEIMYREHRNESGGNDVRPEFDASVDAYASATADLRARDGVIADVAVRDTVNGFFIAQDGPDGGGVREMTSDSGDANWTVAGDVDRTRDYRMTVDSASLDGSDSFTVVANRSNETWTMSLSNDADDAIDVTVTNGTDTVSETFNHDAGENVTIDVTGGTVDGEPFPALVWAENVQTETGGEYDVRYEHGDAAAGTYHLVVEPDGSTASLDTEASEDRSSEPYVVKGVYSAEVEVYHRTPELEYGDVVRVAPGERDA